MAVPALVAHRGGELRTFAPKQTLQQAHEAARISPSRAHVPQRSVQRTEYAYQQSPARHPAFDLTRIPTHASLPLRVQAKLTVGQTDDPAEQEADRIADQVMRMPEPQTRPDSRLDPGLAPAQRDVAPSPPIQTKSLGASESAGFDAPPIVHDVLRSPGRPLDAATRSFFEPRFGRDLSDVRVHADDKAAHSAAAIHARAYTMGRHIVFGSGAYAPQTDAGHKLVAHELAHVAQQQATVQPAQRASNLAAKGGANDHVAAPVASPIQTIQRQAQTSKFSARHVPSGKLQIEFHQGLPEAKGFTEDQDRYLFNAILNAKTVTIAGIAYQGYDDIPGVGKMPPATLAQARATSIRTHIQNLLSNPYYGVASDLVPELMAKIVTQSAVKTRSRLLGRTEGAVVSCK